MPLYEYQCADCGGEFEKLVRLSEGDSKPECPNCGKSHTRKKLSTFASPNSSSGKSVSSANCGSGGALS